MGKKIKEVAGIIFGLGAITSIIFGITVIIIGIQNGMNLHDGGLITVGVILGLVIAGLGTFSSWVISLLVEGFGELIISTNNIEKSLTNNKSNETSDGTELNEPNIEKTEIVEDNHNSVNENKSPFIQKKCPECSYPINVTQTTCSFCGKPINWEKVYDYQK